MLWLWHRPVPTALIRPLAWAPPYATGAAPEKAKRPKKKKEKKILNLEKTATIEIQRNIILDKQRHRK